MFSSLTRNAVNTVLLVCKNQVNGPVTTQFVSKRLGLSISYLEAMLSKLKKSASWCPTVGRVAAIAPMANPLN
jgi:DNA-binding IscR family transcriptional regulator